MIWFVSLKKMSKSNKIIDLIYNSSSYFWGIIQEQGTLDSEGNVLKNELLDKIELLVASEATKNGTNVVFVPSDSAIRAFLRTIGLRDWRELAALPSASDFVLSHIGSVESKVGRGGFGAFTGAVVGGTFISEVLGNPKTSVGLRFKTNSNSSCDDNMGLVSWVIERRNDVKHLGSANRYDTVYAGSEYDVEMNEEGRLDCADFYSIPKTLDDGVLRDRLLFENRPTYQRKF